MATTTKSGGNRREQLAAARLAEARAARRRTQLMIAAGVVVGLLVIALVAWVATRPKPAADVTGKPAHAVGDTAIAVSPGKAKAGAPQVVVYSDFQCPWCKRFDAALGAEFMRLVEAGDITLQYRSLAWLESQLGNDASTRANEAAACADLPAVDRYHPVVEALYAAQPGKEGDGFTRATLREQVPQAAGISGDGLAAYQKCLDERSMLGFVQSVDKAGQASLAAVNKGQIQTPIYVVNGKVANIGSLYDAKTQTISAAGLADLIKRSA